MNKIIIRGMTHKDLDRIAEIERKCFSVPWSRDAFEGELINELAYYQCAEADGTIVGYMGMWKIVDECHITNVAVLPEFRKHNIASMLIEKMVSICKCSEISDMTLEVRESNMPAINLYTKFGFFPVGKRPRYYHMPVEDAIIMWKKIV